MPIRFFCAFWGLAIWSVLGLGTAYGQQPAHSQPAPPLRRPSQSATLLGRNSDSVRQAFVRASGMRHLFGGFYRDTLGRWATLELNFGARESELRYHWMSCPAFDSASFHDDFPYWRDRNRVVYPRFYNPNQELVPMPEADPATFRSLHTLGLAVDKNHVYQNAWFFDDLDPALLHVYTLGGERYNYPNPGDDAYLVSGKVIYPPGWQSPLPAEQVRTFVLPAGYQLVYPLPIAPPPPSKPR